MYKIIRLTIFFLTIPWLLMAQVIGPVRSGEERFVASIDASSMKRGTLKTSRDGLRIAWVERLEGKEFVVVDGVPLKRYDEIGLGKGWIFFSDDGSKIAFYGRKGKEWFLVSENLEKRLIEIPSDGLSPNSIKSISKEEKKSSKDEHTEVLIYKEGDYIELGVPVFSQDKKRVAYGVKSENGWSMVVDGKAGQVYDRINTPTFGPDGRRVVYIATLNGKQTVVADGIEGDWYNAIYPMAWQEGTEGSGIGFFNSHTFYYFAKDGQRIFFITESIY